MASQYTGKRKMSRRLLTGVEELDKKLEGLKNGAANKISRPALTKAARYLLKVMKQNVPANMKDAKRALGMRVDQKGGKSKNEQRSKVGAGVGRGSKAEPKGNRSSGGVGIGGQNIHWFILGTQNRVTESGKSTGSMPSQMPRIIQNATTSARSEMLAIMRNEVFTRLAALAGK